MHRESGTCLGGEAVKGMVVCGREREGGRSGWE